MPSPRLLNNLHLENLQPLPVFREIGRLDAKIITLLDMSSEIGCSVSLIGGKHPTFAYSGISSRAQSILVHLGPCIAVCSQKLYQVPSGR